jgi:hypothetical protein
MAETPVRHVAAYWGQPRIGASKNYLYVANEYCNQSVFGAHESTRIDCECDELPQWVQEHLALMDVIPHSIYGCGTSSGYWLALTHDEWITLRRYVCEQNKTPPSTKT